MWNPATAVLWESWRLSRLPMAIAMFLATLGGAALIVLPFPGEMGVTLTVPWVIYLAWFSQHWALKIDGRKGFSLLAGFSRPIPTWVLVTVPMAYVAASSAVTYLVPILVLRTAFDIPLPHLPVAALVSTLSLSLGAFSWSSANPVRRRFPVAALWLIGMSWLLGALMAVGDYPADGLTDPFSYSTAAYGWMGLLSVAAFLVAIPGVARQRRGDDAFSTVHPAGKDAMERPRSGLLGGIANRFRTPCPTSSPMSAQLWLEVYTVGGPVLKSGTLTALAAPIFFTILSAQGALGEGVYFWVWFPLMVPVMVALPSMLGLRRRQGVSYLDAFAATRPVSTGHLVGLKVLVTSLSIFLSWAVLLAVLWVFAVWLAVWGPETQADSIEYWGDWFPPLSGAARVLLSTVYVVSFTASIAAGGTLQAFMVLNGRRVVLTVLGAGLYMASWVIVGTRGWVDMGTIETIVLAHLWIVTLGVSFGTAYFFRRWMAERICTWRGLSPVLVIGVGFLIMSLYLNPNPDDMEDHLSAFILGSLPLMVMALLPWSFSHLRHR